MSLHYYQSEATGILKGKVLKDTLWYRITFLTHVTGGLLAILLGPFQFMEKLLLERRNLHKKLGYVYSVSVASSAMAGLVIAQFAMGGLPTRLGFSTLSLLWGSSLIMGVHQAIRGDIVAHKKWMQINYALTFSSVTQRTILLFAFVPSFSFMSVYQASAWVSWMFNLAVVLLFNLRSWEVAQPSKTTV